MYKCVFCDTDIIPNQNESVEHIIQNALGGKYKSKKVTCNKCADELSKSKVDNELIKQFQFYTTHLDIKRDRGKNQDIKATGKDSEREYIVEPGGKPVIYKPLTTETCKEDGTICFHTESGNRKQAINEIKRIKSKYKLDISDEKIIEIINNTPIQKSYVEPLHFQTIFGGKEAFRGVVKNILLFIKDRKPSLEIPKTEIISFLKGNGNYEKVSLYYPEKDIISKSDGEVYHSIVVKSYPKEALLIGFLELFSIGSFICVLSESINEDIQEIYVYDVLNCNEITDYNINLPMILKNNIKDHLDYPKHAQEYGKRVTNKGMNILKTITDKQRSYYIREIILKHCPEGEIFTKERLTNISNEIAELVVNQLLNK